MKNRFFPRLSALLLAAALLLSGCGSSPSPSSPSEEGKLKVVATVFPAWDWTREILGEAADDAELTLLTEGGIDLHNYQPSAQDILKISSADIFLYVGGESDAWVKDVLRTAVNPDLKAVCLLDVLGESAREEEIVPGMEDDDHDHDHDHEEDHEHEEGRDHEDEGPEYDEHVWLSLKNASLFCKEIARVIGEAKPALKDTAEKNLASYLEKLADLDTRFAETARKAPQKTFLFADRFPFLYLAGDYGISYYAAFPGCSAETEASFQTVTFLAGKVNELGLKTVLVIEGSDRKIAEAVVRNTQTKDLQILTLHSLQSVTRAEMTAGATYLSLMEEDLKVLEQALN